MSRAQYKLAVLTPLQAQAFAKLVRAVIADIGHKPAAERLGVSVGTVDRLLRDSYLTDKMAPVILRNYKAYKAERAAA